MKKQTVPDDTARAVADRGYWKSYGLLVGATLVGWSYKDSATFAFPNGKTFRLEAIHTRIADAAAASIDRRFRKRHKEMLRDYAKI